MSKKSKFDDEELETLKQLNIRVSEAALLDYEAVRDTMYVRDKTLSIRRAIEDVLKKASKYGRVWLSDNPSKTINAKKEKELADKKVRRLASLKEPSTLS